MKEQPSEAVKNRPSEAAPRISTRKAELPRGLTPQEQADWHLAQNPFGRVPGCPL